MNVVLVCLVSPDTLLRDNPPPHPNGLVAEGVGDLGRPPDHTPGSDSGTPELESGRKSGT